jgi:uncharacterized membrane protein YgcG
MNPAKVFRFVLCLLMVMQISVPIRVAGADASLTPEQLDQMLAQIALYPDALLAQVLMASTYPLEVVEADRWVRRNPNLDEDSLNDALDKMDWDPSIKALVPFPQVLSMMSEQLEWTEQLGEAFLSQQQAVMNTIQDLRAKASARGNLETTNEQRVIAEQDTIRIEPADPEIVYVPVYNPAVIYGPWWYPAYPPYYWGPGVAGLAFAAGVAVGIAWAHGWGNWNWANHTINVNVNRNVNVNNLKNANIQTAKWQHDPSHRKGVAYSNEANRQHYSPKYAGSADARRDYRGYSPEGGAKGHPQTGSNNPARTSVPSREGYGGESGLRQNEQSRPAAFEGMEHGSDAREFSNRGSFSRGGGGGFGGGGGGSFGGGHGGGGGGRR